MAGRVSAEEFSLDTTNFDETAELCSKLAEKMENLRGEVDSMKSNLMFYWAGKGRNTFEKKYRLLSQQFGDIGEDLREIAEGIYSMESDYIQADTDSAKALEGKDERY